MGTPANKFRTEKRTSGRVNSLGTETRQVSFREALIDFPGQDERLEDERFQHTQRVSDGRVQGNQGFQARLHQCGFQYGGSTRGKAECSDVLPVHPRGILQKIHRGANIRHPFPHGHMIPFALAGPVTVHVNCQGSNALAGQEFAELEKILFEFQGAVADDQGWPRFACVGLKQAGRKPFAQRLKGYVFFFRSLSLSFTC